MPQKFAMPSVNACLSFAQDVKTRVDIAMLLPCGLLLPALPPEGGVVCPAGFGTAKQCQSQARFLPVSSRRLD